MKRSSAVLLSDHHVGGLDDDKDRVTDPERQVIDRGQADGRRHRLAADINDDLSHHGTTNDLRDLSLELVSGAELHCLVLPCGRRAETRSPACSCCVTLHHQLFGSGALLSSQVLTQGEELTRRKLPVYEEKPTVPKGTI